MVRTMLVSFLRALRNRFSFVKGFSDFNPKIDPAPGKLLRLGTNYGGWYFLDLESLKGATIVCLGAGEDVSFDLEFIAKYSGKAVIADPTPRSIEHLKKILNRVGLPPETQHSTGGDQPPDSYNLKDIQSDQICFLDKAVWVSEGEVKFFKQ